MLIGPFNKNNSYILKKTFQLFHERNQEPHQIFCLSSVSTLPIFPLGYILGAVGLESYICSGITWLPPQDMAELRKGLQLGSTWSAVSPPNTPLMAVANTVQHWFVACRPPTPAALKDITVRRSRLSNDKHHSVWCKAKRIDLKHMWQIKGLTIAILPSPIARLFKSRDAA